MCLFKHVCKFYLYHVFWHHVSYNCQECERIASVLVGKNLEEAQLIMARASKSHGVFCIHQSRCEKNTCFFVLKYCLF